MEKIIAKTGTRKAAGFCSSENPEQKMGLKPEYSRSRSGRELSIVSVVTRTITTELVTADAKNTKTLTDTIFQ